ncbi:hypothetical protein E3N88_32016 [Mikania micrantha]|uniref:Uncharacterized protein n=1 Tax=Mikania micrantha TaxID=192012 RepID=A0A5N6M7T4_9ASTR|nr:hypothetical protein E3N88_32016 [Mikania micrantha]
MLENDDGGDAGEGFDRRSHRGDDEKSKRRKNFEAALEFAIERSRGVVVDKVLSKKDGGKGTATTGNNNNSAASSNGGRPGKKNSGGDGFGGIAAAQAEEEIDEGKGFEPSVSSPQSIINPFFFPQNS